MRNSHQKEQQPEKKALYEIKTKGSLKCFLGKKDLRAAQGKPKILEKFEATDDMNSLRVT